MAAETAPDASFCTHWHNIGYVGHLFCGYLALRFGNEFDPPRFHPFVVPSVRRRFRCWRGETGKRNGVTTRRAKALVGSNPTASTAAPLTES